MQTLASMKYRFPHKTTRIYIVSVLLFLFILLGAATNILITSEVSILGILIMFGVALLIIIPFITNGAIIFGAADFIKGEHDVFIYLGVVVGCFILAQGLLLLGKLVAG